MPARTDSNHSETSEKLTQPLDRSKPDGDFWRGGSFGEMANLGHLHAARISEKTALFERFLLTNGLPFDTVTSVQLSVRN